VGLAAPVVALEKDAAPFLRIDPGEDDPESFFHFPRQDKGRRDGIGDRVRVVKFNDRFDLRDVYDVAQSFCHRCPFFSNP